MSRSRSNDEYRHIIESSIEEYERLGRMVGDIMFLARPDQELALDEIDVRAELEKLVEYYRNTADEQRITINIEGTGTISADPRLFQRALGNVISNALRYTSAGGTITVTISAANDRVTIAVRDTGMGISAADLPRVFDRFYRSNEARLRYNHGSGLGLAIVRSIMALHGGSATLTSEPGQGTVVVLDFIKTGLMTRM